jgi:hypothetical protein
VGLHVGIAHALRVERRRAPGLGVRAVGPDAVDPDVVEQDDDEVLSRHRRGEAERQRGRNE